MTVLVCIPCLLTGGTEIQTLSLVEALMASGHKPVVACYFEYAETMVERYRKAGAEVVLMNTNGIRPSGVMATIMHLWRGFRCILKQYHPKIAHVQYMAPGALPILVLKMFGVKKIIATAHTAADIYPSLRQIHWLNNHILTAFQCITLRAEMSFFGSSQLFDGNIKLQKHDNHFTIYNNLPSYITLSTEPRTNVPRTVGVVSRIEEIKGMDLVVPAFAKVSASYPGLKLLIVGDGSLRPLMEQQVKDYDLPTASVTFVGRKPQDALQDYYDRIDILLMPSRSEGFGLTAIEGMARGCVPVVANVGGLPEVVEDGVCGFVYNQNSYEDIAKAIIMAVSTDFQYRSSAAIKAASRFSKREYQSHISALYKSI